MSLKIESGKLHKIVINIFTAIIAVLMIIGIISIPMTLSIWQIYTNGYEVEGTVINYDVTHVQGRDGYNLVLYCSYVDLNGNIYNTDTQYSKMKTPNEIKVLGQDQIGKKIPLIIDDTGYCVAKRDVQWKFGVLCILLNIIFPILGIFIIILRVIWWRRNLKQQYKK